MTVEFGQSQVLFLMAILLMQVCVHNKARFRFNMHVNIDVVSSYLTLFSWTGELLTPLCVAVVALVVKQIYLKACLDFPFKTRLSLKASP